MSVTYRDLESDTTVDPVVEGPKVVLYDAYDRPLKRQIGFRLDNSGREVLDSRASTHGRKFTARKR